ncbi:SQD2 [Auxenochlorella protothecoides x Auxenochlorella symbiontica]
MCSAVVYGQRPALAATRPSSKWTIRFSTFGASMAQTGQVWRHGSLSKLLRDAHGHPRLFGSQVPRSGRAVTMRARGAVASTDMQAMGLPAPPKRICILVEPSPFTYVCGYMNRYRNTIRYLKELGCEVLIVTPGKSVASTDDSQRQPEEFCGAKVVEAMSFAFPWYAKLPLTFGLSPRIYKEVKSFQPNIVHCTSPGTMILAGLLYARLLKVPLVYAYHTHVPDYMPRYNMQLLVPALWRVLQYFHRAAALTLVTSGVMKGVLERAAVAPPAAIQVWKKGVCCDTFNPRFASEEARRKMLGSHGEGPLLLCVGRLGVEKNLTFLKDVLKGVPGARLALVGDGPERAALEAHFAGTATTFVGMLHGAELAAAYASADVFVMPSESETLGFVVLESMASGTPVVAVEAGGIPDILCKPGVTGFLYRSGDVAAAVAAVQKLVANDQLRAQVAAAAREEVGLWDWRAATQYLLQYQYPMAIAAAAAAGLGRKQAALAAGPTPALA